MRLAAVDGFVLDASDTKANRAAFGGPAKNGLPAGFPQVRVVTLTECGTHGRSRRSLRRLHDGGEPGEGHRGRDRRGFLQGTLG
ncbi:hypothetical protein AB0N17_44530, partial [Streptomyces sp. NPDC051133]